MEQEIDGDTRLIDGSSSLTFHSTVTRKVTAFGVSSHTDLNTNVQNKSPFSTLAVIYVQSARWGIHYLLFGRIFGALLRSTKQNDSSSEIFQKIQNYTYTHFQTLNFANIWKYLCSSFLSKYFSKSIQTDYWASRLYPLTSSSSTLLLVQVPSSSSTGVTSAWSSLALVQALLCVLIFS
jgi:hypothetical protein